MSYLFLGCRWVLAAVLLASLAGKAIGRTPYRDFVAATGRLTPRWLASRVPVRVLAVGVSVTELAALGLLAGPGTVALGFALSGLLMLGFAGAIVAALRRGERRPCHCFGAGTRRMGPAHVVRNLLLATIAGLGLAAATATGPLDPFGAAMTVTAGTVVAALIVVADEIAELFRPMTPIEDRSAARTRPARPRGTSAG